MTELFEYVLIALVCPLALPLVAEIEKVGNPDTLKGD